MKRIEQIIQYLKSLPDHWTWQLDQFLLLRFPALWAHGYSRIFNSLLKVALPAYGALLLLAFLCMYVQAFGISLIILLVVIPILGIWNWLGDLFDKNEKEIYGRVTQLGLGDLYYSAKEERIHRWTTFGLVTLTQLHPFLIFCIFLGSIYSLFHSSKPADIPTPAEAPALILLDHRFTVLDSTVTGFVQNEYHYYVFEKGMSTDQAFQLVYDSLHLHADSLNLRISDAVRIKSILLQASNSDTAFLYHYRHFFDPKARSSITIDTTWQSSHYLLRHSWQQLTIKLDNTLISSKLWNDSGWIAIILVLFVYRYIISIILRDLYFIDLILLHIPIPETYLSNLIKKAVWWFILILFTCIFITLFAYFLPRPTFLQYLAAQVSAGYFITQGKLLSIFLDYLGFLTVCTFINYFVFFPKVRRQIMVERIRPGEIPYYEVKPVKNKMKQWIEKMSNVKVRYSYTAGVRQNLRQWSARLLPLNPELWRRDAIRFTYELWLFMGAGLMVLILLFGLVQVFIKANNLSENWIYDYLAIVGILLRAFPIFLAFFLYSIKLVQNPSDCLLPDKFNCSFNFRFEKWVGAWLGLLVVSLFLYLKLGLYIFLALMTATAADNLHLGEMNSQMRKFGAPEVLDWHLRSVTLGEYWYLTNTEKLDSVRAVNIIRDSIMIKLDDRYWTAEDKVPSLWGFRNQDSFSIQQNYLKILQLPTEDTLHGFAALREARKDKRKIISILNEHQLLEGESNIVTDDFIYLFFLIGLASLLYFEDVIQKELPLRIWKHFRKYRLWLTIFVYMFVMIPLMGLLMEKLEICETEDMCLYLCYYPAVQLSDLFGGILSFISLPVFGVLGVFWLVYFLPSIKRIVYQDFYEPE